MYPKLHKHCTSSADPEAAVEECSGHASHVSVEVAAVAVLYVPWAQSVQAELLEIIGLYLPAPHATHWAPWSENPFAHSHIIAEGSEALLGGQWMHTPSLIPAP